MTGVNLLISTSSETELEWMLLDAAPRSIMSAPSLYSWSAWLMALSVFRYLPPSEKESSVIVTIPINWVLIACGMIDFIWLVARLWALLVGFLLVLDYCDCSLLHGVRDLHFFHEDVCCFRLLDCFFRYLGSILVACQILQVALVLE